MWHEAIGTIKVYDIWTRLFVAEHQGQQRAAGIGHKNAGRKALGKLARALAPAIVRSIREHAQTLVSAAGGR